MALSDWDKKHLNANQQRAVRTYTAEWEKAKRAGNEERMQWAHNGAEAIRKQAGYSGGTAGETFRPTTTVKADTQTGNKGYDNGGLQDTQVKAIQKALGVEQDGRFGPKTQEAAFQRWGASDANSALKAFLTTNTPKQTSFSFDEDEGLYHWNGKTYSSQKELTDAINKAGLSAAEKNIVSRKAENSGSGVKLSGGNFSGKPSTVAQSARGESKGSNTGTSSAASHTGSGRSLDSTVDQELAAARAKLDAANARYAGSARYSTVAERKELRSEIKELEQEIKTLEAMDRAKNNPTLFERLAKTLSGTAKQYTGSLSNAAGVASAAVGGTAMSSVYKDQVDMLDRQIESLERIVDDPTSTREDIADATDALRIAREQRALYGNAVRAGEGTASEVYKISDELSWSGAADIDRAKQGASKLGKVGIDVFSQGAQMAADVGLGAVTGVGALGSMAARSFGSGAQEARQGGANLQQAALYGAGTAAVEVLTEKMFDGLAGIYGKGGADDIVKGAINRLTKNEAARRALSVAASAAGESVEEFVSGIVNPALKTIYNGKGVGKNYSEMEAKDVLYDMLIGGIMGGLGSTVDAARGNASVGDAATAYLQLGGPEKMNLSTAEQKGAIVDKARAGEMLTEDDIKALDLSNAAKRGVFNQLTGLQLDESVNRLMNTAEGRANIAAQIRDGIAAQAAAVASATPRVGAGAAQTMQADNLTPAQTTPTVPRQTSLSAAPTVEKEAAFKPQTITPQEFAERYRQEVNPNAGVGEVLASYDALMREYQKQVDNYEESRRTIDFKGYDMNLADLQDYIEHTARLGGIEPMSMQDIKAAFDAEYKRQNSETKNAASTGETTENSISPAQDAGLSGNPISEPSGQSLGQTATRESTNILPDPQQLVNEKDAERFMKEHGEQAYVEAFTAAMDKGDIKLDANGKPFVPQAESHIDNRDRHDVGNRRVKAFQFENPEIHPFYEQVASVLLDELSTVQKGGELIKRGKFSDPEGEQYLRTKRGASEAIVELRDDYGFSYKDIEKALKAIIADEGQENIAVAKRLELLIDELLENDYTSAWGSLSTFVDIDAYREAKAAIRGAQEQETRPQHEAGSWEAYLEENRLPLELGEVTEAELRAEWEDQQAWNAESIVPEPVPGDEPEARRTVKDERNLPDRNDSVGSARAAFTPEQVRSRDSSTASALNEDERQMEGLRPEDATHWKMTNAESLAKAKERLDLDYDGEVADLPNIRDWGAVEMDMAQMILRDKVAEARESGDYTDVVKWKKLIDERKSTTGQALQANAKYAGDSASIIGTAAEKLEGAKLSAEKKAEVLNAISRQADKLGRIADGDTASLAELVKENSTIRRTNSLFGNKLSKALEALIDGDSSDHLRLVAQAQIESMANDYVPRGAGNQVRSLRAMSMLSNLATVTRNLVSNNVFDPIDSLANNAGVPLDMLLSQFTGTRSTALDGSWLSKAKRQASAEALARSAIEVALDVDTDTDGGTNRYGQSSKRTFKMTGSPVERFLSTWAKWQGYLLNSTDEFQKGGIRAETQRGVDALKAQGRIKDDSLDTAGDNMAKYRTFQDDTRLSQGVGMLHDAGNKLLGTKNGEFGLGDVVIPFGKVPSNLVARVWDYSPAGVAKGMYDLASTLKAAHDGSITADQQAKAVHELSRGTTGTALIAGFAYLAKEGLLRVAGDDEDKDKAALDSSEGKYGVQLNLDATLRHLKGESADWKQGDTLVSMGSLDPISAHMMIGALLADDVGENGLTAAGAAKDTAYGTLQTLLDLPGMSTIENMVNDYKYSGEDTIGGRIKDAALGTAADLPGSFIPNALKAVARGTDNTYRDLYTSGSLAGETRDALLSAVPGARQTLPEKVDPFGRTKTYTDDDVLNFLNAAILPGAINRNKQDALSAELERLYTATGSTKVYPNRNAPKTVRVNGEDITLTSEQREQYQRAYGTAAYDLMEEVRTSDAYRRADDKGKVELLSKCLSYATDTAKEQVLGVTPKNSVAVAIGEGVSPTNSLALNTKMDALTPESGHDGVTDMQRYRLIANEDMPESEKIKAVGAIMGTEMTTEDGKPSQYAKMLGVVESGASLNQYLDLKDANAVDHYLKYQTARGGKDYGLSTDDFVKFKNSVADYDADGNGSFTQREIQVAITQIFGDSLSNEQRAVLWQLYNKSWKPQNNPYSHSVGRTIYNGLHP